MINLNEENKNIIDIPAYYVKEITLLTAEEAKKLPKDILNVIPGSDRYFWYWLRDKSPVEESNIMIVNGDDIDSKGVNAASPIGIVRPILKLRKNYGLSFGDEVNCLGKVWYYIGNNSIL